MHPIQQVDILDDQIRHLAADSHDVGDEQAQSRHKDEAERHYLQDSEQTSDRPRASLIVVDELEDDKLVDREPDSACDRTLSCFANTE